MARRRSHLVPLLIAIVGLAVAVYATARWWLPELGYGLIHGEQPVKADLAVVLAGDYSGNRMVKAAELVKAGYVPAALVSGPLGFYGSSEADLAIDYIVKRGYPRNWFIAFPNQSLSTREEASYILPELRRRGVHSFLLVTSDYHTARARRIYLAMEHGAGPEFRTIACPAPYFHADSWWKNREGEKTVFLEWCKTVATAAGK